MAIAKKDVETGLARFVVAAHVADRINRGDEPQQTGQQGEYQPQGLEVERDRQPRQGLDQGQPDLESIDDRADQLGGQSEQRGGRDQGDAFAHIGPTPGQGDQHGTKQGYGDQQDDQKAWAHGCAPSRTSSTMSCDIQGQSGIQSKIDIGCNQQPHRNQQPEARFTDRRAPFRRRFQPGGLGHLADIDDGQQ